jgi:glycosyltransferase domain-containing protein
VNPVRPADDPALFSFVMPTRNRPEFVHRALSFLDGQGFRGHLILVDASDAPQFIAPAPRGFQVTHHKPARPEHAWREIADALRTLPSRYVQLHHDDDFYFLDEIDAAIGVLDSDPTTATAQGRFVFVELETDGSISIASHDRFGYHSDSAVDRVSDCFSRFCHLAFAVTRRADYLDALDRVHPVLEQGWFDQYAISLLLAGRGKSRVADRLFGIREMHASQHHRQFIDEKAYRHWPLIVAAPDFSDTFAAFKSCLMAAVPDLSARRVDLGLASLIERVAGGFPEREPGDVQTFERANQNGTEEHARITRVVAALRASRREARS